MTAFFLAIPMKMKAPVHPASNIPSSAKVWRGRAATSSDAVLPRTTFQYVRWKVVEVRNFFAMREKAPNFTVHMARDRMMRPASFSPCHRLLYCSWAWERYLVIFFPMKRSFRIHCRIERAYGMVKATPMRMRTTRKIKENFFKAKLRKRRERRKRGPRLQRSAIRALTRVDVEMATGMS